MEELFLRWIPKKRVWLKRIFVEGIRHYKITDIDLLLQHVLKQIELHSISREGIKYIQDYRDMMEQIGSDYENFSTYCSGLIERERYFEGDLKFTKVDIKKPSHRATLAIMNYILNELPNLPHHKPTTKVYKHCFTYFVELLEGRFMARKKSLKRFIDERRLSSTLLTAKIFKIGEIKQVLCILDSKIAGGKFKNSTLQDLLFLPSGRYGSSSSSSQFLIAWNELQQSKDND